MFIIVSEKTFDKIVVTQYVISAGPFRRPSLSFIYQICSLFISFRFALRIHFSKLNGTPSLAQNILWNMVS